MRLSRRARYVFMIIGFAIFMAIFTGSVSTKNVGQIVDAKPAAPNDSEHVKRAVTSERGFALASSSYDPFTDTSSIQLETRAPRNIRSSGPNRNAPPWILQGAAEGEDVNKFLIARYENTPSHRLDGPTAEEIADDGWVISFTQDRPPSNQKETRFRERYNTFIAHINQQIQQNELTTANLKPPYLVPNPPNAQIPATFPPNWQGSARNRDGGLQAMFVDNVELGWLWVYAGVMGFDRAWQRSETRWFEVAYNQYESRVNYENSHGKNVDIKNLNNIVTARVNDVVTLATVYWILANWNEVNRNVRTADLVDLAPGVTVTWANQATQRISLMALLATPVGRDVAELIGSNKDDLGVKRLESVQIFRDDKINLQGREQLPTLIWTFRSVRTNAAIGDPNAQAPDMPQTQFCPPAGSEFANLAAGPGATGGSGNDGDADVGEASSETRPNRGGGGNDREGSSSSPPHVKVEEGS